MSSATPCAASFTSSSFMSPKGRRVGRLASGSPRATALLFSLKSCVRRVLYVLALHVSSATATAPAATTEGLRTFKERATIKKPLMKNLGGVGMRAVLRGVQHVLRRRVPGQLFLRPALRASVQGNTRSLGVPPKGSVGERVRWACLKTGRESVLGVFEKTCARDKTCAPWCSRLPSSESNDRGPGLFLSCSAQVRRGF